MGFFFKKLKPGRESSLTVIVQRLYVQLSPECCAVGGQADGWKRKGRGLNRSLSCDLMLPWQVFKPELGFEDRGCVFDSKDLAYSRCSRSDCRMTKRESDEEAAQEAVSVVKSRAPGVRWQGSNPASSASCGASGKLPTSLCLSLPICKMGVMIVRTA